MIPALVSSLPNHLWQSTVFGVVAGLLAFALRRNRAQVRYCVWLSASLKFFVPFSLLMGLGSQFHWAPAARDMATQMTTPEVSYRVVQISEPFPAALPTLMSTGGNRDWVTIVTFAVWACGFACVALIRFRGWLRVRAAVRSSRAMNLTAPVEVRSSPGLLEPGVVGWMKPVLLMPEGIEERLTPAQLEALLAHELCHVRRRDNLFAAIHMVVEAMFWFLPRVWWIGSRLIEERERACDEEVLSAGTDPQIYAEAILNVCKLYVESPLVCVAGVTGADIRKRIEAIMSNRQVLKLNFIRKLGLATAGVAAFAIPVIVGILNTPAIRAQSAKSKPAARPKFEVASIRPCGSGDSELPGGGTKKGGGGGTPSPGRLFIGCMALVDADGLIGLIHRAYDRFADGHLNTWAMTPISGGPAWIKTEQYDINAKADGAASDGMMNGPMLQVLLEERFKLKVHRETRQMPVYELTVAKGGPKIQPFKEGSCAVVDFTRESPVIPPGQKPCVGGIGGRRGPNITSDAQRTSLEEFAKLLGLVLDRPVIDKTGISGLFDFHLAFGIDQATPRYLPGGDAADFPALPSNDPPAPGIFTAIQEQLGLKLEPTKGPREYIVIDHVEKPTAN